MVRKSSAWMLAIAALSLGLSVGCNCLPKLQPEDCLPASCAPPPCVPCSIQCIGTPVPKVPDPRTDHDQMEDVAQWELSLTEALAVAFDNSQVVRSLGGLRPSTQIMVGGTTVRTPSTTYDPGI